MVNYLRQNNNNKKKHHSNLNTKNLIFSIGAAILVLLSQPKDLLSAQSQQHSITKPDDENIKTGGISLSTTASELIDGLPKDYQEEAYKLVRKKQFNFAPAGKIKSRSDLGKIASDLSQAPMQSFGQITGFEKYSRENASRVITALFNPSDSIKWFRKGFEKKEPTPDELNKYNKGITDALNIYLKKLEAGGSWDKEIGERKLDGKVFSDFETLFNYGISNIPEELRTREVYRRLFVSSASLAEYKNALNKNDTSLPIIATQVSEYISLISPEQTSEKLYIRNGATYRLPSDYDIDNLSKRVPLISSFSGIGAKALAVLIQENSSNPLSPIPPTSGLGGGKKPGNNPNLAGNNGGNSGVESGETTLSPLDDLLRAAGAGFSAEAISILNKLAEKRKKEEDKILEAQRKINEIYAESQNLVAERNELQGKITDEEAIIGRELYNFGNQCSTITPTSESLKRDLRNKPATIDNIPEGIGKIDTANSNIANTSSSIKLHYKTIIGYEARIKGINERIIANNDEIAKQQKIIQTAQSKIKEIDSTSQSVQQL